GPTAHAFSHMPRELMLRYAAETLGKRDAGRLSKDISGIVPGFSALDDPESIANFRSAYGSQRAALNRLLDQYRDKTGMGVGQALLATADPDQLGTPLTQLRNVGTIASGYGLEPSTHPSYNTSIPGEAVGRLQEPVGALDLLPDLMAKAGITDPFDFPVGVVPGKPSPLRSLQMRPQSGIITEDMLRAIDDRLSARP
ncbi:MAG TPA: hypothetical protein VFM10_11315, partial [Terriglobales bacterium]|nr:hypothetical protein [Terriglobales bacterium]